MDHIIIYSNHLSFLVTGHDSNLNSHQESLQSTKIDLICEYCGSQFLLKSLLEQHILTHLPPSFQCSKGDRQFGNADKLNHHLELHQVKLNDISKLFNKMSSNQDSQNKHTNQQTLQNLDKYFNKKLVNVPLPYVFLAIL